MAPEAAGVTDGGRSIPFELTVGNPPPESWGWELDFLLTRLCDHLDICKSHGYLTISLDAVHSCTGSYSAYFIHCLNNGCRVIAEYLNQRLFGNREARTIYCHKASSFQTPTLMTLVYACSLDDVNLGHVFDALRLAELLDNAPVQPLSLPRRAEVVCSIIGELDLLATKLSTVSTSGSTGTSEPVFRNAFPDKHDAISRGGGARLQEGRISNTRFIRATIDQLLDFLAECGRDRVTYLKEVFSRMPNAPPRPHFITDVGGGAMGRFWTTKSSLGGNDATTVDNGNQRDTALEAASALSMYNYAFCETRADAALERLLLTGSLLSMHQRLAMLWHAVEAIHVSSSTRFTPSIGGNSGGHSSSLGTCGKLHSGAADRIRWAIFRAVHQMPRHRRIIFTRLLEALCSPVWVCPGSETESHMRLMLAPRELIQLVVSSFLHSEIPMWPFESASQLDVFERCPALSLDTKRRLLAVMTIPDSLHFAAESDTDCASAFREANISRLADMPLNGFTRQLTRTIYDSRVPFPFRSAAARRGSLVSPPVYLDRYQFANLAVIGSRMAEFGSCVPGGFYSSIIGKNAEDFYNRVI